MNIQNNSITFFTINSSSLTHPNICPRFCVSNRAIPLVGGSSFELGARNEFNRRFHLSSRRSTNIISRSLQVEQSSNKGGHDFMDGLTIKTLEDVDFAVLHDCWCEAFSDYAVSFQFPKDRLRTRLSQVSYDPSLSLGVFDGNQMVGFWLSGLREIDDERVGYGAGTAFYPYLRGKGLGKKLYEYMEKLLIDKGVSKYILEVFCDNDHAVALYEKKGFVRTKTYLCYRAQNIDGEHFEKGNKYVVREKDLNELSSIYLRYIDYLPSWQNDMVAMISASTSAKALTVEDRGKILGYGIIQPISRRISQIGVIDAADGEEVFKVIIRELYDYLDDEGVVEIVNIQEGVSRVPGMLEKIGFVIFAKLYEMRKVIL